MNEINEKEFTMDKLDAALIKAEVKHSTSHLTEKEREEYGKATPAQRTVWNEHNESRAMGDRMMNEELANEKISQDDFISELVKNKGKNNELADNVRYVIQSVNRDEAAKRRAIRGAVRAVCSAKEKVSLIQQVDKAQEDTKPVLSKKNNTKSIITKIR